MRCVGVLLLVCAAPASAQWSEPVLVAQPIAVWAAGPTVESTGGDTLWAAWIEGDWPQDLRARCFTGDTWRAVETVMSDSVNGVHWPASAVNDSGQLTVACYLGDYPVCGHPFDTWGIYTVTRGPTGWGAPELVQSLMMGGYPGDIELARSSRGEVGMVWSESHGGINAMDSVMYSRKTPTGWTERKCLAPGRYPDINCSGPSLVAGDSTDFCIAFGRWDYPDACTVHVVTLGDTVLSPPTSFPGRKPKLARSSTCKFLVYVDAGRLMGTVDAGAGWQPPTEIASGVARYARTTLCVDAMGYAWACWTESIPRGVFASYSRGGAWSEPEAVGTGTFPVVASDAHGTVHCFVGQGAALMHMYRIERPGVAEGYPQWAGRSEAVTSTIMRAPDLARTDCRVLDITGRDVTKRKALLSPGVYFLKRDVDGGELRAVQKVVIQR